ncbi:FAS1 domain-containing protein [Pilaira anomala]|nr:FAS1 domain-containing protein [Pilaira anomala]
MNPWKRIQTLFHQLQNAKELMELFDQNNYNITLLLPNEAAINNSLETGTLNFSSSSTTKVYDSLGLMTLNGTFSKQQFLSKRQFYQTVTNQFISIGPELKNNNNVQLYSGRTKAQTSSNEIICNNGVILFIDHFLQPAENPLITISNLPETEYMEGLLKSLNVSDTISGINKTIFVPINEAWESVNGSTLPFGTLVHNLKYSVIDGVFTLDQIIRSIDPVTNSTTFMTDYKKSTLQFQLLNDSSLIINQNTNFYLTDILTTTGIIHLIDHVLSPDHHFEPNKTQPNNISTNSLDSPSASSSSPPPLLVYLNIHLSIIMTLLLLLLLL